MELYEKDLWTNPGITSIFGGEIIEYDIESAGYNLIIKYKLLPEEDIKSLTGLKKDKLVVKIGNMQRKNPEFAKRLAEAFVEIRRLFFESNGIATVDVVSIKKDAIFLNRNVSCLNFDNVVFRPKHIYTSYLRLDKIEIYYNKERIDYKNLGKYNEKFYKDSIEMVLKGIFHRMETKTKEDAIRYLRRYMDKYKKRELDISFYCPFRPNGIYELLTDDPTAYPMLSQDRIDEVNIYYNWVNVFSKLALILI